MGVDHRVSALAVVLVALMLGGCGGGGVSSTPNTTPVIVPASGSTSIALGAAASSTQLTVSETGYHGTFTATSSNAAVATVSPASLQTSSTARTAQARVESNADGSATFTIIAVQNGTTTIIIVDDAGRSATFTITVTGLAGPSASPSPSSSPSASPSPTASPSPSPSPVPTASPGPLSISPGTLTFNGTAQVQTVQVTDPGTTAFTVSGCSGVATLGAPATGSFTVTSVAAGSCTVTVSDAFGHQVTVNVGVTTFGVPIQ
jgi:hypothetical protein